MIFLSLLLSIHSLAAHIEAASNISQKKMAIAIHTDQASAPNKLVLLNLADLKTKKIHLPQLQSKSVARALLLSERNILLLIQRALGDANNPTLYVYDLEKDLWKENEVPCSAFDALETQEKKLLFSCNTDQEAQVQIPAGFPTRKWSLPLESDSNNEQRFSLIGPVFKWNFVQIGRQKKLSLRDLEN